MGKPLISNAELRGMLASMQRAQAFKAAAAADASLSRAERFRISRYPVALAAALATQLRPGDSVLLQGDHPLLQELLQGTPAHVEVVAATATEMTLVAAGAALHEKAFSHSRQAERSGVVFALLDGEPESSAWIALAHQHLLPLIVIARGPAKQSRAASVARQPGGVPAIAVDDADAVALCRVLQESRLRAQHGWSSVLVQALHFEEGSDPVAQLQAHLRRRGIAF